MNAFIVAAGRSAGGKRNGLLSHIHPAILGAHVIDHLLTTKLGAASHGLVDDVIIGCVSQVGSQTANLGTRAG